MRANSPLYLLFQKYYIYLCTGAGGEWVQMCHHRHVEVRGQLVEVSSLLLPTIWGTGIKLKSSGARIGSKHLY